MLAIQQYNWIRENSVYLIVIAVLFTILLYKMNQERNGEYKMDNGHEKMINIERRFDLSTLDDIPEETLITYFYAPWCDNCNKFEPEWKKLMKAFKRSQKVILASVDCDVNKQVCDNADVRKLPTIRFTRGGRTTEYPPHLNRSFEDIIEWLLQMRI